jgi:hypothetical protein
MRLVFQGSEIERRFASAHHDRIAHPANEPQLVPTPVDFSTMDWINGEGTIL